MTWKPTEGLLRAPFVVEDLQEALDQRAWGSVLLDSVLRYRVTQIITAALDNAINAARDDRKVGHQVHLVQVEHAMPSDWVKDVEVVPNGPDPHGMLPDPHPDGASMMGGDPSSEYHSIIDEERALTKDIRAKIAAKVAAEMPKKAKPRRKKAKAKKAAKQASEKHSGDNPPTGD